MLKKTFVSEFDKTEITYYTWEVKNPKATFHIIHGSIEHAKRYDDFAKFLNTQGFSVFAMDIRGHGETGKSQGHMGHFVDHKGHLAVLSDVHQLNNIIKNKEFGEKLVLLGHSMGSFIARAYITQYNDVDILIAIGTNHKPRPLIYLTKFIARAVALRKPRAEGLFLHNLSYKQFDKKFKLEGDLAWLSLDKDNIKAYKKDPLTKLKMSYKAFHEFSRWMLMMTSRQEVKKINKGIRILLLNGTNDPVGSFGNEVVKANKYYTKNDLFSEQIEYEDMRHEVLNDSMKEAVYKDIAAFVGKRINNSELTVDKRGKNVFKAQDKKKSK